MLRAAAAKPVAIFASRKFEKLEVMRTALQRKGECYEYYHNERWNADLL
jgi:hypothetical protein